MEFDVHDTTELVKVWNDTNCLKILKRYVTGVRKLRE